MRDRFFRSLTSVSSSRDSWIGRVIENFQQVFTPTRIFPSSANGAPIHLLTRRRNSVASRSRTISLLAHVLLISGLVFVHIQSGPPRPRGTGAGTPPRGPFTLFPAPDLSHFGQPSLGVKSGGGEHDPRPARHGFLAPGSSMPILPPRQIVNATPELPVITAVFDPNASQVPPLITNPGLPWMKDDSNSAGPGKDHGFGSGKKGGMGDDEGPGAGQGDSYNGRYANVATLPQCAYCPDPQYTDEARQAKLQGKVTLRVLVGPDGRASQIQIIQGVGLGLDERAAQSVRTWKFIPARDAARRPVATLVTIEVVFRLI
jgi:periplasmic protein TonB